MINQTYVPLHLHTHYSLLDSISKVKDVVAKAKAMGLPCVAITDHGTMSGTLAFYNECVQNDIKPLLGSEIYVSKRHRTQKENRTLDGYYHLVLIAMNQEGWSNLSRIITEGYKSEHFYYRPRIDRELLIKYNKGLIALSACMGGNVPKAIMKDLGLDPRQLEEEKSDETYMDVIRWHQKVFGDRFYLEIQRHGISAEEEVNRHILAAAKKLGIKVIATTDSHYVNAEDKLAHNVLLALGGKTEYEGDGYWLFAPEEIYKRFADIPECVTNTLEVADRCSLNFTFGDLMLPRVCEPQDEDDLFRKEVIKGLRNKFGETIQPDIMTRAEEEMKTIIQMTYVPYFLIVSDYVRSRKRAGHLIGPGRGSAAGSLVSYVLDITDVNPLEYGLSFARFLNKGRASVPEIDFPEFSFKQWKEHSTINLPQIKR